MRWWETSIGGTARGRVIALLRRGEQSVEELARALEVTDNAVRAHLQVLERQGLVRQARVRHAGVVGKPPTVYEIAPEAEPLFSNAYPPVLHALLASLEHRLTGPALESLFRDVGRRLAEDHAKQAAPSDGRSRKSASSLESRVGVAAALLGALGGEVEVERTAEGFVVRGFACPLASAVRVQPKICRAVEELIGGVVGAPARECCERGDTMRCCFEVKRPA